MIKKMFIGTFGVCVNAAIYLFVILLAIRLVTFSYSFSYEVFGDRVMSEKSEEIVPIQVSEGASTKEIASLLEKKKLIRYKDAFVIKASLSQYKGQLQPGNYELSPSMNMDQMMAILSGHIDSEKE